MPLQLLREAGHIGATVAGIDLSQPMSSDLEEGLRAALDDHHVLFVRDQSLDREAQKRLTAIFGPLLRVPYIVPLAEDPDVVGVLEEASERGTCLAGSPSVTRSASNERVQSSSESVMSRSWCPGRVRLCATSCCSTF